ncbi:MAG: RNA-guided pseudouridylation complex pseudouridine synthase subunit Cbf5 [Nanoarchaeota archaeon]|nr:RNA-guided pseudouridylation complex pseudouridine synthase subunit Cbf5 [Nanoarchaeota archaeon]
MKKQKSIQELLEFGIINLDKPSGPTSFQTDEKVKHLLGLRKMSHFGTLDPKVTGVLPIALNRACKLTGWFMKKEKTYVGIMKIHKSITEEKLKQEIENFVGKIKQLPPVKSRVKRQEREREVYFWNILEFDKEKNHVLFETKVEAGTYIRKLIHDLGLKIGGAHMIELRRTQAGVFSENDKNFINLYDLEKIKDSKDKLKQIIVPAEKAIKEILPVIEVNESLVQKLLTGKPIFKEDISEKTGIKEEQSFAVFCKEKFIGIYKMVNEKDIIAKPEFVFN